MKRQSISQKQEAAHRCAECANVTPITDQFTRCADGAPLLGRCPHREFAFMLDDDVCDLFNDKK